MNVDTIPDFLTEQRDAAPAELQHLFLSFEDLWERKLWHQLTDALIEFFNHKESAHQRLPFYKTFILTFADKINQLKLVTLALSAASQCRGKVWRYIQGSLLLMYLQIAKNACLSWKLWQRKSTILTHRMPMFTPQSP
jgi:hypothetical protein